MTSYFEFRDTPANRAHADAINETMRIRAELAKAKTFGEKSKAALPRLLGCAALALGIGGGIGAACYGVSAITGGMYAEQREQARVTAEEARLAAMLRQNRDDLTAMLEHATLHANVSGEVGVRDGIVRIDPNSAFLHVIGKASADVPRPIPEHVRQDEPPASQAVAPAGVVTNYVVFHNVRFGRGEVESGWEFKSSADALPSKQYCQYRDYPDDTRSVNFIIGRDGRLTLPATAPAGVDLRAAFASCVWTGGANPAPVAPSNTNLIHAKS
jgi:hypothetical protein